MSVVRNGWRAVGLVAAGGALAFAAAAQAQGRPVAIIGATVFDATGAAPHLANVVIQDGRIAEVGPGVKSRAAPW